MANLYQLFDSVRTRLGATVAVEIQRPDRVDAFTFDDLGRMAALVAAWLAGRGCRAGDRVGLFAPNDARWCAAFIGIQRLGAVAVPLDTAYTSRQVAALAADCGIRHLVAGPRLVATARDGLDTIDPAFAILTLDDDAVAGDEPPHLAECPASAADPAVILYTSGTTADPKGVVLTHANVIAEREAAFTVLRFDERDAILSVLPLFHALALLANLILPFTVGARVVFLESVNTHELLRALRERGISVFCCVPQFFYLIHQQVIREVGRANLPTRTLFRSLLALNGALRHGLGVNLGRVFFGRVHRMLGPRMRMLITGGSRFEPAPGRDLVRLGFDILQAYGLTECCGAATVTRPGDLNVAAVGNPLPGVEVRIAPRAEVENGDGEDDDAVRDGEVLIRGAIVMLGYYGRPDANAASLVDGWLRTGDLGYLDERGRLFVTGRAKDVIVLASGKNLYPEEIEAHYAQSPFIEEICVFGLAHDDTRTDVRLHALIVPNLAALRERKIVNMREQLRFEVEDLSIGLPSTKRILGYDISLEPLPRTTTRKLKRFAIERRAAAVRAGEPDTGRRATGPADQAWSADPEVARLLAAMREHLGPRVTPTPDASLELDLGLDSMSRVELLVTLEQAAGVQVAEGVTPTIYSVRDLIEAVRTASAAGRGAGPAAPAWDRLLHDTPPDDPALAGVLRPRPVQTLLLFVAAKLGLLLARATIGFRARGLEHMPAHGPFIVSPNHQSYLDAFLLVSAFPYRVFRRMFFVGASEYFDTPLRARVARLINVVPVDPDSNLVRAMQAGAHGLRHGKVLILFPEGERSIDGTVKRFKKGAAILSIHTGAPIVPVALDGVHEVWPRNRPLRWRALLPGGGRVAMRVGAPLVADGPDALDDAYVTLTDRLREMVQAMWDELRRSGAPRRESRP